MWKSLLKNVLQIFSPVLIDFLLDYAVKQAEEQFNAAKTGKDKKAYVLNFVAGFVEKTGLKIDLNKLKLDELIEKKVASLINRI